MCRKEISYIRMSQKEREQLHAEFQILSTLRHPNIVAYYHREHLKMSQDLHFYMEYCGNGDLGRVIGDLKRRNQRAPESFVWSIFSQLLMALYRCHYAVDPPAAGTNVLGLTKGTAPKVPTGSMTILHRDLKPENVFLDDDNSVKLGDFGLSKMIKSHDFASTYVGTPFYMSPEICAAENYSLKSDIWSLGCIIYELCARDPPFNAKTHFQLVQKIKEGKVAPLPDMYSAELNAVIRDCLKVNPDKRPDTAELLSLPVVKLMRKEKEVSDLNRTLLAREEALKKREKELTERLAKVDNDKNLMRHEVDASLRREWEVKARLEIDRHVNTEIERLQKRFDDEVRLRVEAELAKKTVTFSDDEPQVEEYAASFSRLDLKTDYPHSSVSTTSVDDFPSTTDISEYSIESPADDAKELKKRDRTPFARAQTMFAGHANTPMDVEMASPSPMAIASLSLSPRRTGATKVPHVHSGNIFAANAAAKGDSSKWDALGLDESDDDDDAILIPSPSRQVKSSRNPFTSKERPVLTSQKTCPVGRSLKTQTSVPGSSTGGGLQSKVGLKPREEPRSPNRRLSKIPSAANLQTDVKDSGLKPSLKKDSTESLSKLATKNNIKGRTLVELQQARAGNRPLSAIVTSTTATATSISATSASGLDRTAPAGPENMNTSPKRGNGPTSFRDRIAGERRTSASSGSDVAMWDPDKDEMPSPFLVRQRRINKA